MSSVAVRIPFRRRPRQPFRWRTLAKPPLSHFVILSLLLHALAVLVFGAPSGGSREGRALWGSLQVVILDSVRASVPALKLDRGAGASLPSLARPPLPVPAPTPSRPVTPPAPPPPLDLSPAKEIERRATPAAPPETPPTPAPQLEPAPIEVPFTIPPLLDRIVTPERKLEMPPAFEVPAPRPVPVPAPEPPPTPPVERAPVETPAVPVAPIAPAPITAPVERAPVETQAVPVPVTPPVARPPVEVPAIPVPSERAAPPPKVEQSTTPIEKAAPPPAVERAAPPIPERAPPAKIEREPPMRSDIATPPSAFRQPPAASDPFGKDAPSSSYDPTAPQIDLDAARRRAGQIAREGTGRRAILPFPMPPGPEYKSKEQIAIEKARKPDCKTAYQSLGLLAVVPLLANEFGEGNCRW